VEGVGLRVVDGEVGAAGAVKLKVRAHRPRAMAPHHTPAQRAPDPPLRRSRYAGMRVDWLLRGARRSAVRARSVTTQEASPCHISNRHLDELGEEWYQCARRARAAAETRKAWAHEDLSVLVYPAGVG